MVPRDLQPSLSLKVLEVLLFPSPLYTMLSLWLMKEIKRWAELVSIAEPGRWDDPPQKLLLTMVAAFAEFEMSLISSRLSAGRKIKARQGGYAGGKAPHWLQAKEGDQACRHFIALHISNA